MSLKDVYQRFLADHKSVSLAPDASLIYIPTTTKLEGPDAVIAHLSKQNNIVKPKAQDVLGVVEGAGSLCLDVETTLEFVAGGGAYLPSLDDNFLVDHIASFPTVSWLTCRYSPTIFYSRITGANTWGGLIGPYRSFQ